MTPPSSQKGLLTVLQSGHALTGRSRRCSAYQRCKGLILVVVLIMVTLLALLAASYTLMVRAHFETVKASVDHFHARMAADAGLQQAIVILRGKTVESDAPGVMIDLNSWYDDPTRHRRFLVKGKGDGIEEASDMVQTDSDERTYDSMAEETWRSSLIAPDFDDPGEVRYGITDECARLDLNLATEAQLVRLFEEVIPVNADNPVDIQELVAALICWRTAGCKDAEYYGQLDPPYRNKGGAFVTPEELLLVKGFTGWIVFGEDYNQNGLLDENESDGDETFPPDDNDELLFRGVAAYLTIWSQSMNTSSDNRSRINLNMQDLDKLQEKLEEEFDSDIVNYIISVRSSGAQFNSVMNLLDAPPTPEVEDEDAQEGDNEAATQPDEGDTTSQPNDENDAGSGGNSSDQNGANGGSENANSGGLPVYQNLTGETPPGTLEDLPLLLDRLTVNPSPYTQGRINVSTAPREVLATIEELTDAELNAMIQTRKDLRSEDKTTPAWLVTENVLSEYQFRRILEKITTKSSVYRADAVGYADDRGVVARILTVFQMRGPIPQVIYYRDMGSLGMAYTPHGDERREDMQQAMD